MLTRPRLNAFMLTVASDPEHPLLTQATLYVFSLLFIRHRLVQQGTKRSFPHPTRLDSFLLLKLLAGYPPP